jgi:hypothetical protein
MQADAELEVAALGQPEVATGAISKKVRAIAVPDPSKDERFKSAILSLDSLPTDRRIELVKDLLNTRPVEWPGARQVFAVLSDAIPDCCLAELARWSVRMETSSLRMHHLAVTFMDFWKEIIENATDAKELVDLLEPALLHHCDNPPAWEPLRDLFTVCLAASEIDKATKILDALAANRTTDLRFVEHRWAIVFNACSDRHELASRYQQWLQKNVQDNVASEIAGQAPMSQHYLKRIALGCPQTAIEDEELRNWLTQVAMDFASWRPRPTPDVLPFLAQPNPEAYKLIPWGPGDRALVTTSAEAIVRPEMLFGHKATLLAILGRIVQQGSDELVDQILPYALRWLKEPIRGIDPNDVHGGPFGIFDIGGHRPDDALRGLVLLQNVLFARRSDQMRDDLGEWIFRQALSLPESCADVVFHLMVRYALLISETHAALAMAVVGMTEAISASTPDAKKSSLVLTFSLLLTPGMNRSPSISDKAASHAGTLLLKYWQRHLGNLAQVPVPEVRQAVAAALRSWRELGRKHQELELPDELTAVFQQLKLDARARVRRACLVDTGEEG